MEIIISYYGSTISLRMEHGDPFMETLKDLVKCLLEVYKPQMDTETYRAVMEGKIRQDPTKWLGDRNLYLRSIRNDGDFIKLQCENIRIAHRINSMTLNESGDFHSELKEYMWGLARCAYTINYLTLVILADDLFPEDLTTLAEELVDTSKAKTPEVKNGKLNIPDSTTSDHVEPRDA
jgi:hypothetical protein